jgi:hypothetical protein
MGKAKCYLLLAGLAFSFGSDSSPVFAATVLDPSCGPSGTLVMIEPDSSSVLTGATVNGVPTSIRGVSSPFLITIPHDAEPGEKKISLKFKDGHEVVRLFSVVSKVPQPLSSITAYEFHGKRVAVAGRAAGEIVLYGSGFDTNSQIILDGHSIDTFTPGISEDGGSSVTFPVFRDLRCGGTADCPSKCFDKAIVGLVPEPSLLAPGNYYRFKVRGEGGGNSEEVRVPSPSRKVLVEVDRAFVSKKGSAVVFTSSDLFPELVARLGDFGTLGRVFSPAEFDLEVVDDRVNKFPVEHPEGLVEKGAGFTESDVADFHRQFSNLKGSISGDEGYIHLNILTHFIFPDQEGFLFLGTLINDSFREGVAVFASEIKDEQAYLRTVAHEIGHALNLTHCEADANGLTIMTPEGALSEERWTFGFSEMGKTHLQSHPLKEVMPGRGNLPFDSAERIEKSCGEKPEVQYE